MLAGHTCVGSRQFTVNRIQDRQNIKYWDGSRNTILIRQNNETDGVIDRTKGSNGENRPAGKDRAGRDPRPRRRFPPGAGRWRGGPWRRGR